MYAALSYWCMRPSATYPQVKPPAVIIFRGEGEGEIPLVLSGKLKRSEMAALLEANKRGTHVTSFTSTKVLG